MSAISTFHDIYAPYAVVVIGFLLVISVALAFAVAITRKLCLKTTCKTKFGAGVAT